MTCSCHRVDLFREGAHCNIRIIVEVAYQDARKYLPALAAKWGSSLEVDAQTLTVLDSFQAAGAGCDRP